MAAAGSQTIRHDNGNPINKQNLVRRIDIDWIADAAGAVTELAAFGINGKILALATNPGSPAPTANYDIRILNEHGIDVLQGLGANRHTTTTEMVSIVYTTTDVHPAVAGPCTLEVLNAGNLGAGSLTLYIEQ